MKLVENIHCVLLHAMCKDNSKIGFSLEFCTFKKCDIIRNGYPSFKNSNNGDYVSLYISFHPVFQEDD